MQENHRMQGHLFGAFSVLVWGTTFVSTKVLLRAFTPLEIMVAVHARLSGTAHRGQGPHASAEKMA